MVYKLLFLTVLLVTNIPATVSHDGCEDDHDQRFGDICISNIRVCYCGNRTVNWFINSYQYCCGSGCYETDNTDGKCPDGKVLPVSKPCNGECLNQYQDRKISKLGWRSQFQCDKGDECVAVRDMCGGSALCQDKSDLGECHAGLQCTDYHRKCPGQVTINGNHSQCYYPETTNDDVFNCLTREDEPVLKESILKTINYDDIKHCKTEYGYTGLMCGEECKDNYIWCRTGYGSLCSNINVTTNDETLCSNYDFWSSVPCDFELEDGTAPGKRCTGQAQHCYYPSYTMHDYSVLPGLPPRCEDYSDQVHLINSTCDSLEYIQAWYHTFCGNSDENIQTQTRFCNPTICENNGENYKSSNLSLPVYGVLAALLLIILFMVSFRCFWKPVNEKAQYEEDTQEMEEKETLTERADFDRHHDKEYYPFEVTFHFFEVVILVFQ